MIYFDNSATTQIEPSVLDTYMRTSQRIWGNPSSLHSVGGQAYRLVEQSRKQIASLLDVSADEIFFTSGGTEGDNWVVKGTAIEKAPFGKEIILSAIEHPAVTEAAKQLERLGFDVKFLPVDNKGFVKVEALKNLITSKTILVSVMAINNEIGTIQPIQAISEVLEAFPKIHFHVDAVQAIGKMPITSWLTSRVDFAVFSAHKFHGPKGVGIVYLKEGKKLAPLLNGGGQEQGLRNGTENVPGIVATAKALRILQEDQEKKIAHQRNIKQFLLDSLEKFEKVTVFSGACEQQYAPHILCFSLKGVRGEVLVHAFEKKEVFISTTSACSSKKGLTPGTLQAMSVTPAIATGAVRLSLCEKNTMVEAEQFMIIFQQLYQKFSKIN